MNAGTVKNDFPTWLTPAIVKELRQGMRSPAFLIIMSLFPVAMALIFMLGFFKDTSNRSFFGTEEVNTLFWIIMSFSMLAIMPIRALFSVNTEINNRTSDLLLLTRLTPFRIAWGKWSSFMLQSALLASTMVPFVFVRYYYGSINLLDDLFWVILIFASSACLTSIALWTSGTSNFLRIPFMLGSFALSILFITMISDFRSVTEDNVVWAVLAFIILDLALVCTSFIIMTARWFALPSDNLSKLLRIICMVMYIPLLLGNLAYSYGWFGLSLTDNALPEVHFWAMFSAISFILILELTSPPGLLPGHIASQANKRFKNILNFFFVPGFFSAAMFALLLFAAIILILTTIQLTYSQQTIYNAELNPREFFTGLLRYPILWAGMIIVAATVVPARKRLKGATTGMFYVVLAVIYLIYGVLNHMDYDTAVMFLPVINFFLHENSPVLLVSITFFFMVIALVLLYLPFKHWRNTMRQANQIKYLKQGDNP